MSFVVHDITAGDLEIQRDRAVPGHREDVEQLFEVRPMVLVVTPGDRQPRLLAPFLFQSGIGISTVQRNRGGVVVQLVEIDLELLDHMGRQCQDHGGDVTAEQPIETAPDAVVVERWQLGVGESECHRVEPGRPFPDAIQWLAGEEHVLEQERDANRGSDSTASIGAWKVCMEEFLEAHTFEEPIDDRQGTDAIGGEGSSLGARDFTRTCSVGGTRNMTFFRFFHPCSPDEGVNAEERLTPGDAPRVKARGFLATILANMVVRRKQIVKACTSQLDSLMIVRFDVSRFELILPSV